MAGTTTWMTLDRRFMGLPTNKVIWRWTTDRATVKFNDAGLQLNEFTRRWLDEHGDGRYDVQLSTDGTKIGFLPNPAGLFSVKSSYVCRGLFPGFFGTLHLDDPEGEGRLIGRLPGRAGKAVTRENNNGS